MTQTPHEARRRRIAEIIEPWVFKALRDVSKRPESERTKYWRDVSDQATRRSEAALAKADAILADDPALVLVEALSKFMPIEVRETRDYAEITFGDHQTQAMTMAPDDWVALNTALAAYQSTDKGDGE